MIIGSHNSWSYLAPKLWYLKPFSFMARCQNVDIKTQYEQYGVRCFDLRIRFNKEGDLQIAHGYFVFDIDLPQLYKDLNYLNSKGDCYVRILYEVRNKKQYVHKELFKTYCRLFEGIYSNIKFWCGRNLYNWEVDYEFKENPSCLELYSSVCAPKLIDDWYPKIYALKNNKKNIEKGTDRKILLIDFVNIK